MRMLTLSTLAVLPAALIAQAPVNISQQLRAEQPVIDGLVKSFKAKEALVKAEALIAIEKPAYNKTDLNTVGQSQNAWRDLMIAHIVAGRTAFSAGEWEKAVAILEKGLVLAKENKEAFVAGAQPTLETWKAPEKEAKDFFAQQSGRIQELSAKADKTAAEIEELKQLESAKGVYENNLKLLQKIQGFVDNTTKVCDEDIKLMTTTLEKGQGRIKDQSTEIETFNTKLKENKKNKVQIKGNSNWVDAVMNDQTNFTKLTGTDQVGLLNRLLVLDAGNAKAQKALENILAGKDPFAVEKKAPAKGKAKKSN